MAKPTGIPEGRNYERADESARSLGENQAINEEEFFTNRSARQEAQRAAFERDENWKGLRYDIRTGTITLLVWILWISIAIIAIIALWMAIIVLVHFTIPQEGWLTEKELNNLGSLYTKAAPIIAPVSLMSNAWIIAIFSLRQQVFQSAQPKNDKESQL